MKNLRRPRKSILTRDQAHSLLQQYYDELIDSMQKGLDMFLKFQGDARACARPRTLACVLNDCIVNEASNRFEGVANVKVYDDYECRTFLFQQRAALRFKKVDGSLRPSNIRTKRQNSIEQQEFEIDDAVRPTVINVGYEPNVIFSEIKDVSLSCRRNGWLVWEIPLVNDIQSYLFDNDGKAQESATPKVPVVHPKIIGKAARNA